MWSVEGWIAATPAEPLEGSATVTDVMGRSVNPNALLRRIRIGEPPMDICRV